MAPVSIEIKFSFDGKIHFPDIRKSATFLTIYQILVGYKSNSVITAGLPYEVQKFAQSFVNQTYEDMYAIAQWL